MEDIKNYPPLLFFENGYYTISDAIDKICATYNVTFDNRDPGQKADRKALYQHLWRELKSMNLRNPEHIRKTSARKTEYSYIIWNSVLRTLYPWICQHVDRMKQEIFVEWKKREMEYGKRYARIVESQEKKDALQKEYSTDFDRAVENEFQKRKLAIALDFLFSEYIELNEKLLRADICNDICIDEAAVSAYDLMVNERLTNPKNYYTVKKAQDKPDQDNQDNQDNVQ